MLCKIALYPMGIPNYMNRIVKVWHMAKDTGLQPSTIHYATRLIGDVQDIFAFLESVCHLMEQSIPHYILHFALSVNSPTVEE